MPGRAGLLVKKPFKDSPHTLRSSPVSAWSPGTCGSLGAEQGRPGVTLAALSSWASCRRPRGNVSFPIHIRPFLLTLCHTELCCRFVLKAQKATDVKASNFLHRKQKQNVGKGPPPVLLQCHQGSTQRQLPLSQHAAESLAPMSPVFSFTWSLMVLPGACD